MSEKTVSLKVYFFIFFLLMVFTAVTVGVAFMDLGAFNTPVAITIAVTKAVLVILYFMHVRYASKLTWVFAAAGFYWFVIMLAFTMGDFITRGWLPLSNW